MLTKTPTAVWIEKRRGKRGTSYRLRWVDPRTGKWESEAVGRDLAFARERRDQIRQALRDGFGGKLPHTEMAEFVEMLPSLMCGKSPSTIETTQDSIRLLEELAGPGHVMAIDRAAVMKFRAKRMEGKVSPATANKDLRQIRSALSYAVDAGLIHENPLLRWKSLLLREPEKVVRVVEESEFAKLQAVCEHPAFQALLTVAYRQGLRRMELANLRWTAVDLERQILHVVNRPEEGEFTKSRKNRSLPMHPAVKEILDRMWATVPKVVMDGQIQPKAPHVFTWPGREPFVADWLTHAFAALVKKAQIPPCTLHDLRRSFSTLAQRAGVDKHTVKDLGGWSVVSVVEKHYTGDVSEVHRRAMKRIAGIA